MIAERFSLRKENRARTLFRIANTIFLALVSVCILVPVLRVVSDSLDRNPTGLELRLIPSSFTVSGYVEILSQRALYRPFLVSVFVTSVGTALALVLTTTLAYGLIQRDLPGRTVLSYLVLFTMIFHAGLIPTYMTIRALGIMDTLLPVILAPCLSAFYLILMMNFFRTIPQEYAEAAEVEGAGRLQVFWSIVLPLARPGLAAIGLFYGVQYWNDFFSYVIYINNSRLWNFQVMLRDMVLESESALPRLDTSLIARENLKNAVIIVAIVPVAILYPFLQKHFVKGVNLGGIKG